MDGYEEMVRTHTWKAIKKAQDVCMDIYIAVESDGLIGEIGAGDLIDRTRVELIDLENRLREHFKRKSHA